MSAGPSIAFLMPTGRCNLDCEGCYATLEHAGRHSAKGELTLEQYEEVVGELVSLGVRVFDISGGEPFLYPELPELCELIRSHADTRIWLVTNGTVASREKYASVAGHVERIVFSLDSPEAATHDRLRGRAGAFERTIDAIRLARELPFAEVAVNQLVMAGEEDEAVEMLRLCRRERVDRMALLLFRDVSENGVMTDAVPPLERQRATWEALAAELGRGDGPRFLDLVVPSFLFPESTSFRRSLPREIARRITLHHPHLRNRTAYSETILVKPRGTITGDTAMANDAFFEAGHALEGLAENWSAWSRSWRDRLLERERALASMEPCASCSRWSLCRGGCPSAARHQWGEEWRHDRSCDGFREDLQA